MKNYDVLDICRYVIDYSNKKKYGISNLKLQKILYFIQAYFLISNDNGEYCFHEKIEAWDFGPVVPVAYRAYKQYGSSNIPTMTSYLKVDNDNIWNTKRLMYQDKMISQEDCIRIAMVIDTFADYSATDLVTLTHHQDPWKNAYVPHMNNEITRDSIRKYFNE